MHNIGTTGRRVTGLHIQVSVIIKYKINLNRTYHRCVHDGAKVLFEQGGGTRELNSSRFGNRGTLVPEDSGVHAIRGSGVSTDIWLSTDPVVILGLVRVQLSKGVSEHFRVTKIVGGHIPRRNNVDRRRFG